MGNKRKKQKKRSINWLRIQMSILIVTGIFAVFVLLFLFLFRIKEVTVEGNIHYTKEEIMAEVMNGFLSDNSVVLSVTKHEVEYDNVPFINSINVQMTGRDSVRIRVNEKSVVGYVEYNNEYWYFNRDGTVVEQCGAPVMTAEERIAKEVQEQVRAEAEAEGITAVAADIIVKNYVPEVRGFSFEQVVLGEQLPVEDDSVFNTLYSMNQMMNKDNIPADFVMFDSEYNMYLYYDNVEVRLGQDDMLEEKMTTLASIMPQMEGMSGTLHLENYSNVESGVVFKKNP